MTVPSIPRLPTLAKVEEIPEEATAFAALARRAVIMIPGRERHPTVHLGLLADLGRREH